MDTTSTNPFSADLAQARAEWTAAQASLKTACDTYCNGASVRLAEILAAQEKIRPKIAAADRDQADAEDAFKSKFEAEGFEKTPAVQKTLNQRNDAMMVADELRAAAARLDGEHDLIYTQVSSEVTAYQSAYQGASMAYCHMRTLEILEKHGPPLLEAMALMSHVPNIMGGLEIQMGNGRLIPDAKAYEMRRDAVLQKLRSCVDRGHLPAVHLDLILGPLELGPMSGREPLTPAAIVRLRHSIEKRKQAATA